MVFDISWITRAFRDVNRRIDQLTPSIAKSFLPVTQTIVDTVIATVHDTYTTTVDMLAKIASPGNIAPGNVTASGQVQSNGAPFLSVPSHDHLMSVGNWVAGWIDSDGQIGTSPSSGAVKTSLTPMDGHEILDVTPYWGRYAWDAPDAPLKVFVLAEDVQAAGFGTDVAPVVESPGGQNVSADPDKPVMVEQGQAWTVNYSQLVVPLLAAVRAQKTQIDDLTARVIALESR